MLLSITPILSIWRVEGLRPTRTSVSGNLSAHSVAISCGYDTCFAIRTCDGLYHFMFSIDRVGIPFGSQPIVWTFVTQKLTRSTLALKPSVSPPSFYPWVTATHIVKCLGLETFRPLSVWHAMIIYIFFSR